MSPPDHQPLRPSSILSPTLDFASFLNFVCMRPVYTLLYLADFAQCQACEVYWWCCVQLSCSFSSLNGILLHCCCCCCLLGQVWLSCDPVDCSLPGSSIHGISQARVLEWVATPSSKGSSQPRDRTHLLAFPALTGILFGSSTFLSRSLVNKWTNIY